MLRACASHPSDDAGPARPAVRSLHGADRDFDLSLVLTLAATTQALPRPTEPRGGRETQTAGAETSRAEAGSEQTPNPLDRPAAHVTAEPRRVLPGPAPAPDGAQSIASAIERRLAEAAGFGPDAEPGAASVALQRTDPTGPPEAATREETSTVSPPSAAETETAPPTPSPPSTPEAVVAPSAPAATTVSVSAPPAPIPEAPAACRTSPGAVGVDLAQPEPAAWGATVATPSVREARIVVEHPSFGPIELGVTLTDSEIEVTALTQDAAAAEALRLSEGALRHAVRGHGIGLRSLSATVRGAGSKEDERAKRRRKRRLEVVA